MKDKTVGFTKDGQAPKSGPRKGKRHRKHDIEEDLSVGVPYSLNKKNRWLLPSEIKRNSNIGGIDSKDDESQHVTLKTECKGFYGNRYKQQRETWYVEFLIK